MVLTLVQSKTIKTHIRTPVKADFEALMGQFEMHHCLLPCGFIKLILMFGNIFPVIKIKCYFITSEGGINGDLFFQFIHWGSTRLDHLSLFDN